MVGIEQLKTWRGNKRLTQQQAADEFDVARETWTLWESGKRKIGRNKLPVVAQKTGIPRRVLRPDLAELLTEGGAQ